MNPLYYGFFRDLEFDVLQFWAQVGRIPYTKSLGHSKYNRNKYIANPEEQVELAPWAKDVLSDPNKCLLELGYNAGDFSSYIDYCTRRGY